MAKTKISEFSATAASNTDIDSINIAEGCAPSGINDAIRELMSQLKDFQTGAVGDSFNGPVGSTTAAAGAFTTLTASSTLGVTGVATLGAGAILNTPASVTLTNATGLPISTGVSGLGSNVATFLATPSSANLAAAVTDETGSGALVFATSPTLVTPTLGVATATSLQGIIGNVTPAAGAFTTVTASSTLSVTGAGSIEGLTVGRGAGAVSTNTAVGASAIAASATGTFATAVGTNALQALTSGGSNTGIGGYALNANTTGANNSALGVNSLVVNTTGSANTAAGVSALFSNTTASNNTAVGQGAGYYVTTGSKNTIIGRYDGNQGGLDIRTASNNIVLSDGDGNPRGYHDATNWYFPSVDAQTTGGAANVNVGTNGVLRKSTSSLKYKRDVQNAAHGLTELLQLRSVTYKSKSSLDGETVYGGLIAEEVEAAGLSEFVMYAPNGTPDALAYGNMVSLCVKAIQELKAEFDAYKASHP